MLNQDFREFIELLNKHDVKHLVVGGYAVALHGYPRYTKDIDIWIWLDPANADRTVEALREFGFGALGISRDDFLAPDQIIQLGYPPARIDLITTLPGVEFQQCYPRRVEIEIDGVTVNVIDRDSLKMNKRASGRLQDLADLENLD